MSEEIEAETASRLGLIAISEVRCKIIYFFADNQERPQRDLNLSFISTSLPGLLAF